VVIEFDFAGEFQFLHSQRNGRSMNPAPVALDKLKHYLRRSELLVEYVLDNPRSSVLAITRTAVHR
jgi:hypothetical protein